MTLSQTLYNLSIDTTYLLNGSTNQTYTLRFPATIPSDGKMHSISIISVQSGSVTLGITLSGNGRNVYYANLISPASSARYRAFTLFTSSDMTFWYGFYYAVD